MARGFVSEFDVSLADPTAYVDPSSELRSTCLQGTRTVFRYLKTAATGGRVPTGPLDDLYVEGFDNTGVWEEIELVNQAALQYLSGAVERVALWRDVELVAGGRKESCKHTRERGEEEDEEEEEEEEVEEDNEVEEEMEMQTPSLIKRETHVKSVVDDRFFKLSELEDFLGRMEREEEEGGGGAADQLNLFRDWSSDEDQENARYGDFFDRPGEDGGGREGGGPGRALQKLSTHEKRRLRLQDQITKLEAVNVAEKSWQMTGEVGGKARPVNSLMEDMFEFEHMTRPPPQVTEETTRNLEDVIRQRIMDEAWDDVERKVKPVEKPYDYSRRRPLDQEKSQLSLAEVYEQEYSKQTQASEDGQDNRHKEIQKIMESLFHKLDALSNLHFTPKPPQAEVKVISNVPAVAMEEVAPVASSDLALLAPEELQARSSRPVKGGCEKSATDRLRERRLKKKQKRLRNSEKKLREKLVSRMRVGLSNKYSKRLLNQKLVGVREKEQLVDRSLRTSSKFFARLQQEVREEVKTSQKDRVPGQSKHRTTTVQTFKL